MHREARAASDHDQLQNAIRPRTRRRRGGPGDATNRAQWSTGHVCADADDGFKHLQVHVATTAFDSDDNVDAPKCHRNTRKAVLDDIMTWITTQTAIRIQWILWLNGAAGAGKSAIGRSIVELCLAQTIPIARFFFFRADSTRNSLKPVVATLVHQLMECIPELRSIIVPKIQADSLIFTKSLETQFQTLVFGPLLQLQRESLSQQRTVVLLFDGVDECIGHVEQTKLIRTVANFTKKHAFPLIAFFGSRAENQLCTEFKLPVFSKNLLQLPLDTDYGANEDILLFLNDSFAAIKSTHPLGDELRRKNWPAQEDIDEIMRKASGQFIYASVVLKFISDANQDPAQLLEIVRGLRPSGCLTPFAQLDALYQYIFSQAGDIYATSLVLAWEMFTDTTWRRLTVCGTMTHTEIKVALAALKSVLTYTDHGKVEFLHASLPDFLRDPKRSQVYYIDRDTWTARLSILTLSRMVSNEPSKLSWKDEIILPHAVDFITMMESYLPYASPTAELREHAAALRPNIHWHNWAKNESTRISNLFVKALTEYFEIVQKWGFDDEASRRIFNEQREAIRRHCQQHSYCDPSFQELSDHLAKQKTELPPTTMSFLSYVKKSFRRSS